MRVFLTGASGYVGSHVAMELLARGHEVIGLARQPSERTKYDAAVQWCFGDLSDPSTFWDQMEKVNAVVHCAMDYSASGENAELDRQFVDQMSEYEGHFVYTGNLFAHRSSTTLEESLIGDGENWRFQSEAAAMDRKGPSSVIRLGFVYGGKGGYLWEILSPGTLAGLESDSIPDVLWPMIHVRDVASLYATVLGAHGSGVFHAFDGERATAANIIKTARSIYESHGVTGTESHDYLMGLLKSSVETTNQRALSIGWNPEHSSFARNAALAYSEYAEQPSR